MDTPIISMYATEQEDDVGVQLSYTFTRDFLSENGLARSLWLFGLRSLDDVSSFQKHST